MREIFYKKVIEERMKQLKKSKKINKTVLVI